MIIKKKRSKNKFDNNHININNPDSNNKTKNYKQ